MGLTKLQCENAKSDGKDRKLSDGKGLYLQVTANGAKYWRYKYRYLNKQKLLALGVYPEVSLAEAREKHRLAHKQVADGIDPSAFKQAEKKSKLSRANNTFESIGREWYEHKKGIWSENHADTVIRRLEQDVFPIIGKIPITEVSSAMLLNDVIRAIEKRAAHEMARRALQMCSQIFRYAIIIEKVKIDPTLALKGSLKPYKKGHYPAMDISELPEFLRRLYSNEARLFATTQLAIEMLMHTFVRTSELIQVKWTEFDFKEEVWIIPAARMKKEKDHIIPLSKQVIAILEKLKRLNGRWEYVFASHRTPRNHMSNNTILVALGRMGYKGVHSGHGFRALAMSSIKEKLGYRHEVPDRQLAHVHKNTTDAAYDRAKFLDERVEMMQEWSDYLDSIRKPILSLEEMLGE